jgi:DNA repair exonuclease SbcCD nuclease subunit
LLPWIADNNRDETMKVIERSACSIVLGHLEIAGFQMFKGSLSAEGLAADVFDRFELVMSGHYHHKSELGPIHYLGAPYPMIWSDYRDPRGFHLFDTKTHELTFIENPYSLFMRIVYDDQDQRHDYIKELVQSIQQPDSNYHDAYVKVVVRSKVQPYWFDLMMDALYKVTQDVVVVDDIIVNDAEEGVDALTTDVDTLTLMREYVETLSISCDKDELFAYLRKNYEEAIAQAHNVRFS